MLSYRLVRVIEYHSDALASSLLRQVQMCNRTASYHNVPPEELKQYVHEIYQHLGTWLMDKSTAEIEQRYLEIGARRAEQKVPLSELLWAIVLTKHNLWEFIDDVTFAGHISEVSDKQEILHLLDEFFDEAIHAATTGFESAAKRTANPNRRTRRAA